MSIGRAWRRHGWRASTRLAAVAVTTIAGAGLIIAPPVGAASADKAIQKQAVLKKSDLPTGWSASTRSEPDDTGLPVCAGIEGVNADLRPLATQSPDFAKSNLTLANNSVVVLKSAKAAKGYLAPYRDADAVACLEAVVKSSFANPDISSLRVNVSPTTTTPQGADEAAGFDIQVTATNAATAGQPAQTIVLYYDIVFVRVGRALTNFAFLNPTKSLPEQGELVDTVISRLERAL